MGLLEKAGKKKEEIKPKKAAKKAKKTEPKPAKQAKAAKAKPKKEARERKPRDPRVMPDDFQHAGRAAKGARRLVDVIVTYAGIIALLGFTATGSNFNPTLFLLGALIPLSLNMIILPLKTNLDLFHHFFHILLEVHFQIIKYQLSKIVHQSFQLSFLWN